ncbi:helix-turn-helix domain-containing protein [Sphingobacterium luzhongxinii]|uniref:helix-turn-helix domain-containing protein n=1 Tax=Sphingobacterium luzhongxinii TaxID=2654181 RepID=UPI0013DC96B5|nr:helix-turn-helix transcriptional regulator [Sphingobacterium sp. xlx-73]
MESEYEKNLADSFKKFIKALGDILRLRRTSLGFKTIEPFANLVDINISTIGKYERGDENITIKRLYTLLRACGKSHEDIVKMFETFMSNSTSMPNTPLSDESEQQLRLQVEAGLGTEVAKVLKSDHINRIYLMLAYCDDKKTRKTDLKKFFNLDSYTKHFNLCLKIADDMGWINMTYPEKPNAKNQSYYTTEAGKEILRLKQEEDSETT